MLSVEFKMTCKKSFIAVVGKLVDKSPIIYSLVRCLRSLEHAKLVKFDCTDMFKSVLNHLVECNRMNVKDGDSILSQFTAFNHHHVVNKELKKLSKSEDHIDILYCKTMANKEAYSTL